MLSAITLSGLRAVLHTLRPDALAHLRIHDGPENWAEGKHKHQIIKL